MAKKNSSFRSKDRYNFELSYALKDQKEHQDRVKREIKGVSIHGGLGNKFLFKIKMYCYALVALALAVGVYIYFIHPNLTNTYSFSMLSLGLVITVIYWRKKLDQRLF